MSSNTSIPDLATELVNKSKAFTEVVEAMSRDNPVRHTLHFAGGEALNAARHAMSKDIVRAALTAALNPGGSRE